MNESSDIQFRLTQVAQKRLVEMPARRAYEAVFDGLVEHERAAIKAAGECGALHSEFGMYPKISQGQ